VGIGFTPLSKIYLFSKTPSTSEGVTHIPIIQTHYLPLASNIYDYDFIIITSKEAVNALLAVDVDMSTLRSIAISKKSAEYAQKNGLEVVAYADGYASGVYKLIQEKFLQKKILYIRAKVVASDILLAYDNAIVYETTCSDCAFELADDATLIFTSPSTIRCFLKENTFLPSHKIVTIGKTTQAALPVDVTSTLADKTSVTSCIEKAKKLALL